MCIKKTYTNSGISAAKASGAYTIGFTRYAVKGHIPKGADMYTDNLQDVIKIIFIHGNGRGTARDN